MASRSLFSLTFIFVLAIGACTDAPSPKATPDGAKAAIDSIMGAQEASWNRGDVDAFMIGYWNSDSLLFIGKSGLREGYETTLANYKKGYPTQEAMGHLIFNNVKYQPLGHDHMLVVGKWEVQRDSLDDLSGHYSLIWKFINGQWVIIADHSS